MLEAERYAAPVLSLAEAAHGRRSITACTCAAILAEVQYEQNRIDDARESLVNRLDMLSFSVPACTYSAALVHARLQLLQESPRTALDYLDKRAQHFRVRRLDRGIALMLAEQIRIVVLGDDWQRGEWRHGQMLQSELDELAAYRPRVKARDREIVAIAAFSRARLAQASQAPEAVLAALEEVLGIGQALGRGALLVKANLLKGQALMQLGKHDEAQLCLTQALQDAYALGLLRTLLDEGPAACGLLGSIKGLPGKALEVYQQQLCAAFDLPAPGSASHASANAPAPAAEVALTKREEDILNLLEQSMPNKRIARTLNISDQTVKWNLRNIFMKFGVSSRYEAIIIARKRASRSEVG